MKIGVIGIGKVGYPLYKALKYYHNIVYRFDTVKKSDKWDDIISTHMVFICVPTNQGNDGRLDMQYIESTLYRLHEEEYKGIVVIKSTLRLGYIDNVIYKYSNMNIVVFPEWLREVSAFPDTLSPEMTVIGEKNKSIEIIQEVIDVCMWHRIEDVLIVKPEEAVMVKLVANALASTKISFANQMQLICEKYDIDEKKVMEVISKDPRCSPKYLLPGKYYGGNCLPKDTMELEKSLNNNILLNAVRHVNDIFKNRQKI